MNRYSIHDPSASFYTFHGYGTSKREVLNEYRRQWYPNRKRLPRNVAIWQD